MLKELIYKKWEWCLAAITLLFLVVNSYIFYPGFMSYDTLQQLSQAKGVEAYFNWHPPVMAFLWSVGIFVTGKVSSFLIFQMILLWASLLICAIIVYKHTHSRFYSTLPLVFGFLPFVISISGVIWKDVQMAFALLLASCLAIIARYVGRKSALLFGLIGGLCVIYALMLRYNAVFAVIPILYLLISSFIGRTQIIAAIIAVLLLALGANFALGKLLSVRESNPTAAIMLDDVVHTFSKARIEAAKISPSAKKELLEIKNKCERESVLLHALLYCTASERQAQKIQYDHFNDLAQLWKSIFFHNFPNYIAYRTQTFGIFLASPAPYTYVMHKGIDPNTLGQQIANPGAASLLNGYVEKFASHDFGFIFRPYFWLLAAIGLFIYALKRQAMKYRLAIVCLSLSAAIYILGYVPLVIGADYRYIYWSVIATCLAGLLAAVDRKKQKTA
jgi:hypothetical protein